MAATNLNEVRAITGNYFFWQGLRWVPMGVVLVVVAASLIDAASMPAVVRTWGVWLLTVVALWLSTSVLGRYYRRTFGDVRDDSAQHARRTTLKWFVVYPAMLASMVIDVKLSLPILLSGVVWGLSIEAYRRSTGGGRRHYAIAAGLFGVMALLPLLAPVPTGKNGASVLLGLLGIIYVVGGILDHRALVRVLGKPTSH
jgi:hypothetical protein